MSLGEDAEGGESRGDEAPGDEAGEVGEVIETRGLLQLECFVFVGAL